MFKGILALSLAACLVVGGCASKSRFESSSSNLTSDQRTLRANAARVDPEAGSDTVGEAILIGGVVLGAVGCGLALALGGDGGDCAAWGVAGVAVGAAAGYVAGSWVASEQREYASREEHLNAVIHSAEIEVEANQQAAAAARRVTDRHRARLGELQARYRSKDLSRSAYRKEVAEMSVDHDAIAVAVQSNLQRIAELEQLIARGGQSRQIEVLRYQRDQLAAENAILQRQLDEMANLLAGVPSDVRV